MIALGLMSGTSADGVDAALIRTDGEAMFEFLGAITLPYSDKLRAELIKIAKQDVPLERVMLVERELTQAHVLACEQLKNEFAPHRHVDVIGFHGHTIRHDAKRQLTWQIGDAALLSSRLKTTVVSDFRRADIAAGGEGAPLAPLFHRQLFATSDEVTMVLNLGGVANVTWIGHDGLIAAGDTGPGCGLLDEWAMRHLNEPFDRDGVLSQTGKVDHSIVSKILEHDFFRRPIPKSADRYEFCFVDVDALQPGDGAATLCAVTVAGVVSAVEGLPARPESIWVTGGGAKHPLLLSMLREQLGNVQPIEAAGFRSDSLEAECFAWLAVRRLRHLPTSLPETTGCKIATCGGAVTESPTS